MTCSVQFVTNIYSQKKSTRKNSAEDCRKRSESVLVVSSSLHIPNDLFYTETSAVTCHLMIKLSTQHARHFRWSRDILLRYKAKIISLPVVVCKHLRKRVTDLLLVRIRGFFTGIGSILLAEASRPLEVKLFAGVTVSLRLARKLEYSFRTLILQHMYLVDTAFSVFKPDQRLCGIHFWPKSMRILTQNPRPRCRKYWSILEEVRSISNAWWNLFSSFLCLEGCQ